MKQILSGLFLSIFCGCVSDRIPTRDGVFDGLILSCNLGNNFIVADSIIKVKKVHQTRNKCKDCKYSECDKKPRDFNLLTTWPGVLSLDFKQNIYYYNFYVGPLTSTINPQRYDMVGGAIRINKNSKLITFWSGPGVTDTFNYRYSQQDKVLTLTIKQRVKNKAPRGK